MNAVIYARYSSDSQREESIEGQLRECREYASISPRIIFAPLSAPRVPGICRAQRYDHRWNVYRPGIICKNGRSTGVPAHDRGQRKRAVRDRTCVEA